MTIWAVSIPSAPILSLTETSRDQCTVAWQPVTPPANSLITGYVVMIDDGLDGAFRIGYDGRQNPSKTTATANNLIARITYKLKAYAMNKSG